jgi:hypothetical protein
VKGKIARNFTTSLSIMDRKSKQKTKYETKDLNNTIDQMGLTDISNRIHSQ